jgi:hypothetical protein
MAILKGKNPGNIMDIPLENAKWAVAVNNNITDMAMRAERAKSYLCTKILIAKTAIKKEKIRTRKGFIDAICSNSPNNCPTEVIYLFTC